MKLFEISIPKGQEWLAKDLCILIFNIERKKYPKLNEAQFWTIIQKKIIAEYKAAKGTKTIIEILREYRKSLNKKEDK